jgi:hypothetical protein
MLVDAMCMWRPHAVQVFFYKRAQIFVGDLYGAFGGQGLGQFHDIDQITMFAGGLQRLRRTWQGLVPWPLEAVCRIESTNCL